MALTAARVTVSSTAVALNTATQDGGYLTVRNTDATNGVDLGASSVTAGAGFPLPAATTVNFWVKPGDQLYAIRSTANDVVLAIVRS